ncbi:hypothetical protein [Bradyrhizobium sp. Ai1a-2]|uniref:hypothetical protein n=1 Tax=Bradyrhizobium sp. Ai1a-2 TaxID=196490 RepID=UPI000480F88C|nr:hypothetical protein [Bradyrhizobium sp. Ai1a-2]
MQWSVFQFNYQRSERHNESERHNVSEVSYSPPTRREPRQGQADPACPLMRRTNDAASKQTQIGLRYAGIGDAYGRGKLRWAEKGPARGDFDKVNQQLTFAIGTGPERIPTGRHPRRQPLHDFVMRLGNEKHDARTVR